VKRALILAGLVVAACERVPPPSLAYSRCEAVVLAGYGLTPSRPAVDFEGTVAFDARRGVDQPKVWVRCETEGDQVVRLFLDGREAPLP